MNQLITDEEIQTLTNCKSEKDWNDACDAIKRARNGQYPSDWFMRVLVSGLMSRVTAKFGGDDQIHIVPVEDSFFGR